MNAAEVTIAAQQSVKVVQPAGSQDASVVIPASQEVRIPVAASQETAVIIPITQAVNVVCEDSENPTPVYSDFQIDDGGAGTVVVSYDSDIAVTTRARHMVDGDVEWTYTDIKAVYENEHSRTLNETFAKDDHVTWQGGGQGRDGQWYYSASQSFTMMDDGEGGVYPQVD